MLVARIIAGIIGALALVKALPLLAIWYYRWDPIAIGSVFLIAGLFALWFAVFGDDEEERGHMKRTLLIGVVIGAVCFAAGFFGPLIFRLESNQGPLLGFFITGPAGFVAACLGVFVWSRVFA